MSTELAALDYVSPGHASAMVCFFVAVIVLGLGGLWALLAMLLRIRSLRAAQALENAMHKREPRPLHAGPERVIRGKVEVDGDNPVAVEVVITQTAQNHTSKNSRSHSWKESARNVSARPFRLVTESGETIHVEPGDKVMIADGLETEHPENRVMDRLRRCDVKRGETFTVYGDLHGAPEGSSPYRSSGDARWTLKPYRTTGRMLFATETITERYEGRIQFLTIWAVIMTIAWTTFHLIVSLPFCMSTFRGEHSSALVSNTRTYVTTSKNSRTTHYVVAATTPAGTTVEGEVERRTYERIANVRTVDKSDAVVPVILGPTGFPSYLGTETHLSSAMLVICTIAWFLTLILLWAVYDDKAAWYDRARFDEPGGSGHWPRR